MNLTEDEKNVVAKSFFDQKIMKLSKPVDERPSPPLAADPGTRSYYETRQKRTFKKSDFEVADIASETELTAALQNMWRMEGSDELASLAPAMAALALSLRTEDEQDSELSPLIYQMY